jgi:hypothetical protein
VITKAYDAAAHEQLLADTPEGSVPTAAQLEEVGVYYKAYGWSEEENGVSEIPTDAARYWGCKWKVDVAKSLYTTDGETLDPNAGYTYLEIEQYGFDKYTFLLVQKDDQFEDWVVDLTTNAPKLYRVVNQQKIIMPPNYDMWILFEPYGASSGEVSPAGAVRMRTWYYGQLSDMEPLIANLESEDSSFRWGLMEGETNESVQQKFEAAGVPNTHLEPEDPCADGATGEDCPEPEPEEETADTCSGEAAADDEEKCGEVIDPCADSEDASCTTTDDEWTNWDGEQVESGVWYHKNLFSIWGIDVSAVDAIAVSGGLIALVIILVILCGYCSWRKRDTIKETARRASTAIRKTLSVAGEEQLDPALMADDGNQQEFLKSLFRFHSEADAVTR